MRSASSSSCALPRTLLFMTTLALAAGCGKKDPSPAPTTTPPAPTAPASPTADAAPAATTPEADAAPAATTAAEADAAPAAPEPEPEPALVEPTGEPRRLSLKIVSATVRQKAIADAQVIFQKEGMVPLEGKTDASGKVSVESRFGVDDESVTLVVKKPGYSPFFVECPCDGLNYALSETLGQDHPEAIRVVINWAGEPKFLDLHLVYPQNHVFWRDHQEGLDAALDVRAEDAGGPATVTIHKRHPGEQYVLAAHRYFDTPAFGDAVLGASRAKVFVYIGDSLVRSYRVPAQKLGSLWVVFAIDGDGAFHDIDNVVDIPEVENIEPYLRQVSERTSFGTPTRISKLAMAEAEAWRAKGKKAVAAERFEAAILSFQKALRTYPTSADIYTDLATAYEKLGALAEAQWSRRLAAKIAALPPANGLRVPNDLITVTASSNLAAWKHYTFTPDNLLDDNLWSSWQPNRKPAGGVGEWLKLDFAQPTELTGFEVSNGFRLIDELGDLYLMNNRVSDGVLELSDGTTQDVHFEDTSAEKTILLAAPKTVSWARFTVKSVYKGTKWNDLAISELHPLGKGD